MCQIGVMTNFDIVTLTEISVAPCSLMLSQGVFLVKMKNAFVPVKRVYSVNTHSRISTVSQGSERAREQNELA